MTVCQAFTGDHGDAQTFTPFFTASWAIFSCVWLEALETSPVSSMRSLCRESPAPLTVSQSSVSSEEVSEFSFIEIVHEITEGKKLVGIVAVSVLAEHLYILPLAVDHHQTRLITIVNTLYRSILILKD